MILAWARPFKFGPIFKYNPARGQYFYEKNRARSWSDRETWVSILLLRITIFSTDIN